MSNPVHTRVKPLTFAAAVAKRLQQSDLHIIVTGAGGWLGQATLEMLDQCFGNYLSTRVHAFGSSERKITLRSGRMIHCHELSHLAELPVRPYLFLHYAFLTRDKVAHMSLNEFVTRNQEISSLAERHAKRLQVRGIFIPSSGAVYRPDRGIDHDMENNPYGALKVQDEERFMVLADADRHIAICRVFNLAGPFINKLGSYALGSILTDIAQGGPIRLRAACPVERSYVHVVDVVDLAFSMLLGMVPPPQAAFDTAGECVVEVGELARQCAVQMGKPEMVIERPDWQQGVPNRYVGDGAYMANLMAAAGLRPHLLDSQIRDTASYLAQV